MNKDQRKKNVEEFIAGGKVKKPKYKMGKFSNTELQIIKDNLEHKDYTEIALLINRDPYTIKKHIENLGYVTSLGEGSPIVIDNELAKKEFWPLLQTQFTPPELQIFTYHWKKINDQFNNDGILATEELQIIDLIKVEIMMNRNLKQQKDNDDTIRRIQLQLEDETDKETAQEYKNQLQVYSTGSSALTKEYRELQVQKNKLFSDLKATRGDRIKKIEARKESFITWIENLIEDRALRKELGIRLEKFRMAMEQEEKRLMEYHKYEDGRVDRPLFNDKSCELDDDETTVS